MNSPLLEAREVSFRVGSKVLLHPVSLTVEAGCCLAILGPNGAGKSTLLKLLANEYKPAAGHVIFAGKSLDRWHPRDLARRRAVLPQHSATPFAFTAMEVVLFGRSPHGDAARMRTEALHAMEAADCAHLVHRTVTTLSGGELQRVGFARALLQLAGQPPTQTALLLDEPTASLDPLHQHLTLTQAKEASRSGRAVVVILHDVNLAAQYADRLLFLRGGKVAAMGSADETLTPAILESVFGIRATIASNPLTGHPCAFFVPSINRQPFRNSAEAP
jgi:iron complex transport system ATP-binding protein